MVTGLFYTEGAIGNREDLTDILTNISPTETPFISSIGRTGATNTLHEWQTDTLSTALSANAAVEGASAAEASGNATTRLNNYCQIFKRTATISGTSTAMNPAGRANEWSYQLEKRVKEIARDIEFSAMASTAQTAGDTTAGTARVFEGFGSRASVASASQAGWASGNIQVCGTAGGSDEREEITETNFNALLQTIWTSGGRPDSAHVAGHTKQVISAFTSNNTRFLTIMPNEGIKLNTDVEFYRSDFGSIRIVLNRYTHPNTPIAVSTEYHKLAVLRPLMRQSIGKKGDREQIDLVTELTLACYAPLANGVWTNCSSAYGATT